MSNPLTREVRRYPLKRGESVPCDGRIYRDEDGVLWAGIHYAFADKFERARHFQLLARIAATEKGRLK